VKFTVASREWYDCEREGSFVAIHWNHSNRLRFNRIYDTKAGSPSSGGGLWSTEYFWGDVNFPIIDIFTFPTLLGYRIS
jgi:hypothetical protein